MFTKHQNLHTKFSIWGAGGGVKIEQTFLPFCPAYHNLIASNKVILKVSLLSALSSQNSSS